MTEFSDLVRQSASSAWFFVPSAILLGALHGLEPGHSKTMMAAFIVAVRGTIGQAILLAVSATLSHTAIVWIVAILALLYGKNINAETSEPYFQIFSAIIIIGMAVWMMSRTWRDQKRARLAAESHDHGHDHHDETKRIDTGHGVVELSIFEEGVPPRFRLRYLDDSGRPVTPHVGETVTVETARPDGGRQIFQFENKGDFLESNYELPEPHEFSATLCIAHGGSLLMQQGHVHSFDLKYVEHAHGHDHHDHAGLSLEDPGHQDAHAQAHAREIKHQFASGTATTWQVIVFGLTGGLLPCPAAVTVLLLCLQLQRFWLGIVLVLCFSIGLALTLMLSGIVAAWGTRHVTRRWKGLDTFTLRAPYFASIIVMCVGLYVGVQGIMSLK